MTRHDDRRATDLTETAAATGRLALIACALLAGCDEPEIAEDAGDAGPVEPVETPTARDAAPTVCPANRVITLRATPGTCGDIVGTNGLWSGAPLFAQEADGAPVEPQLKLYCEYTWKPKDGGPAELWRLQSGPNTFAASDCEVVWPQGDVLSDVLELPLRDLFIAQLRRPGALPGTPPTAVRIALPDTASTQNVEMNSKHARNMAAVLHTTACPLAGPCARTLARELAMPRIDGGIDLDAGGFYGSQGDLARAIRRSVDRWQAAPGESRLVINLSLGWEPSMFGGAEPPANMKASVRAVYDALQLAVCRGALVVAAAGNVAGDACVADGPLAPARWEALKGPSAATCKALFGVGTRPPPVDIATRPLVHAVGGVDPTDAPLMNARPLGRPRLAAPAFMAVAEDAGGISTALTGSSVAAAAVSGTAALVWSYNAGLTPGQVMDRLHANGKDLGYTADFGSTLGARRINGCRALADSPVGCPEQAVDLAPLQVAADDLLADLDAATLLDTAPDVTLGDLDSCSARCDVVDLYSRIDTVAACADNRVGETTRYTEPQPEWPDCPVCFTSGGVLHMALGEQYSLATTVQVLLETSDGETESRYALGSVVMSNGRATDLRLPPEALARPIVRAILHLTFQDGRTSSNGISVL